MSKIEKNLQSLNEVIVGSSSPAVAKLLARLKRDGRVVRLAPRLYSTNKTDSPENIVRRNIWTIVGKLWPGARLSYRTAFEYAPHDGHVFLGYKYTRKVALPGLTIHFISTPESLPSDYPFMEGLGVSSHARAVLENLEPDRTQGGVEKCLPTEVIEERLEAEFAAGGEAALNKLRDEARAVAAATGMEYAFARLDKMVGALLSTRPANVLKSSVALARAAGSFSENCWSILPARSSRNAMTKTSLMMTTPRLPSSRAISRITLKEQSLSWTRRGASSRRVWRFQRATPTATTYSVPTPSRPTGGRCAGGRRRRMSSLIF